MTDDPHTDFMQWLREAGAPAKLVQAMETEGMTAPKFLQTLEEIANVAVHSRHTAGEYKAYCDGRRAGITETCKYLAVDIPDHLCDEPEEP
jgi:pyruvate-formate lyase-activating enzyme